MPLFEYACTECDNEFELLVRGSETPECPSCHSTSLVRRISVFAAHTSGGVVDGDDEVRAAGAAIPAGRRLFDERLSW